MPTKSKFPRFAKNSLPCLAFALAILATNASAKDREVTVSGTCTRHVIADRGAVTLTAEVLDKDSRAASTQATQIYEKVRDQIKKLGLETLDIKTVESSLNEVKEWDKGRNVSKGFRARVGMKVSTSSIQRLGEAISIATREGMRDIGQLNNYLSTEKLQQEQFACLREAAENARAKAAQLASALDAKVGRVVTLSEAASNGNERPVPLQADSMMYLGANERAKAIPAPTIEAGQQDISATVLVTFALD